MRRVVPDAMLGRASTLLAFVSVAAIPLMQIGFGAVPDFGARAGFGADVQCRMAFGCLGAMIFACGLVYGTARNVDEESV